MVYSDNLLNPSIVELARAGNCKAIAHWISQSLMPYGIRIRVGAVRSGYLKVLVELPSLKERNLPEKWRDYLVRFVCHRIWQLNSAVIEGVRIIARFGDEPRPLWEQSVRVISPARRARQQHTEKLRSQVRHASHRKAQLKTMRSLLMSGTPLFAFVFGCVLGFSKAPVEQTNAVASAPNKQPATGNKAKPGRSNEVRTAMEVVPVVKHDKVLDPNDPTVTLMFSGDVTLADAFADAVGKDYKHAFAAIEEYRDADLAMVNLENPLTKATLPLPNKQFNFKADPESVKVLTEGGVDLVTLANNHTMDFQEEGLRETMETLDNAGVLHLGAGQNEQEARRPEIIDVKGQRVAYLGYYGADFHAAGQNKAGTNYADEARIAADIKSIRDQVDWIIVNYHWGEELATHPADWQTDLAHFTIDQGADLVVGHHPHVLQGAEIYKGRPIAYSLGNFIFGGNSRKDYDTAVLKVALKDRQMKVEFLPVAVRNFQPNVVSGGAGDRILQQIEERSGSFKQPMPTSTTLDASQPATAAPASPNPATSPTPFTDTAPTITPDTPGNAVPPVAPEQSSPSVAPTIPPDTVAPPAVPVTPPVESTTPSDPTVPPVEPAAPLGPSETTPSDNPFPTSPNLPTDPTVPPAGEGFSPPIDPAFPDSTDPSAPSVPMDVPSNSPFNQNTIIPPGTPSFTPDQGTVGAPESSGSTSPDGTGSYSNSGDAPHSDVVQPPPEAAGPVGPVPLLPNQNPSLTPGMGGPADPGLNSDPLDAMGNPVSPQVPDAGQPANPFVDSQPPMPIQPETVPPQTQLPSAEEFNPPISPAPDAAAPSDGEDFGWFQPSEQEQVALNQLSTSYQPMQSARAIAWLAAEETDTTPMPAVALMAAAVW